MSIFRPGVEEQVMIFEIKGLIVYADVNIKWQSKRAFPMIQKAYKSNLRILSYNEERHNKRDLPK